MVPNIPHISGLCRCVCADDTYVYVAHTSGRRFTVLTKGDVNGSVWFIVNAPAAQYTAWGSAIGADEAHVYRAHWPQEWLTVFVKGKCDGTRWSMRAILIPGSAYSVFVGNDYVYIGRSGSKHVTLVNKTTWSKIPDEFLPTSLATVCGVCADKQCIYFAHACGFTVIHKAD